MKVVYSPSHLLHDPQSELEASSVHPPFEHGERIEAVRRVLAADARFTISAPTEWEREHITAVHDPGLVRFLEEGWRAFNEVHPGTRDVVPDVFHPAGLRAGMTPGREPSHIDGRVGWWCFETTTPLTEGTYAAARGAVDTALTATDLVLSGERAAYGLCRPPGHHAATSLYGGYCFFNNAAIAAHHVASTTGTRVTVLDVDYHHGNGTQQIFYERGDVQFVSLHADPAWAYPYTIGYSDETGARAGAGANINHVLAAGTGNDEYLRVLERACAEIQQFGPSLVVVSLGLDTSEHDPICDLALTIDGFGRCGAMVGELGLPTVVLQEGGYHVPSLAAGAAAWLSGLGALGDQSK